MASAPSVFTLNRETLRQLDAQGQPQDARYPTTTVMTKYTCTC